MTSASTSTPSPIVNLEKDGPFNLTQCLTYAKARQTAQLLSKIIQKTTKPEEPPVVFGLSKKALQKISLNTIIIASSIAAIAVTVFQVHAQDANSSNALSKEEWAQILCSSVAIIFTLMQSRLENRVESEDREMMKILFEFLKASCKDLTVCLDLFLKDNPLPQDLQDFCTKYEKLYADGDQPPPTGSLETWAFAFSQNIQNIPNREILDALVPPSARSPNPTSPIMASNGRQRSVQILALDILSLIRRLGECCRRIRPSATPTQRRPTPPMPFTQQGSLALASRGEKANKNFSRERDIEENLGTMRLDIEDAPEPISTISEILGRAPHHVFTVEGNFYLIPKS